LKVLSQFFIVKTRFSEEKLLNSGFAELKTILNGPYCKAKRLQKSFDQNTVFLGNDFSKSFSEALQTLCKYSIFKDSRISLNIVGKSNKTNEMLMLKPMETSNVPSF